MTFVAYYLSWSRRQDIWKNLTAADDRQTTAISSTLGTGVGAQRAT
jgi:hypothetical protein